MILYLIDKEIKIRNKRELKLFKICFGYINTAEYRYTIGDTTYNYYLEKAKNTSEALYYLDCCPVDFDDIFYTIHDIDNNFSEIKKFYDLLKLLYDVFGDKDFNK